ncbi:S8 family peptidase [Roseateles sp.]|uniref:S8 family peptidase n=1 Tax=Roseateles sp. TaxID=1971397 RepID=UPI00286B877B|nr:S8 family peptidase [Roseateles sp.]
MNLLRISLALGLAALSLGTSAQSSAKKIYIVQLADAPAATFTGKPGGLAATKPVAGARFNASAGNVSSYRSFLAAQQAQVLAKIGSPRTLHNYSVSFNGFAVQLTEAQAFALKTSAQVLSVNESRLVRADTTRTPAFLQLSAPGGLWSQLDALARQVKGEDIIIGVIDTGVWPENASFGDKVDGGGNAVPYYQAGSSAYGPPPAKWKGKCVNGEGFNAATMCNNKLIGARFYGDAFFAGADASGGAYTLHPSLEYKSPRDGDGHGSHTASTSGGNGNVQATAQGAAIGAISGIAPRARLAVYKALWTASTTPANDGGTTADILKAIDDAVADGVDVINYSVSGSKTSFLDEVEIAYLNATAAGIFVAASAGNSGPGNEVAHISPWLMTVAASTHDRQAFADLKLGNNTVFSNGVSVFSGTLSGSLILASSIPAAGAAMADAQRCFANSLSATAAVGKIVVCDRGVSARVDKSAEVKRVGGIGMVLVNANAAADGLAADFHSVPSIHLPLATRATINAYAATAGATATIMPPATPIAVVAPVMASFSSRGPNKANGNILKPDITGPGVDILAAFITNQTQAEHDGTVAGSFTPRANASSLSGTSMSSPHIAGAAALLRQLYPNWSVAAVKSALMTSTNGVKLANGTADNDRWGYGAGHMNPNGAAATPLVYDSGPTDHGRFLCGVGLTPPAAIGTCAALGAIEPWNLNLASLTVANVLNTQTLQRKVTNVTGATKTFTATATLPGWTVLVTPATLTLAPGASGSFSTKLTINAGSPINTWSFGTLSWSDGAVQVSSPLSANAVGFLAPPEVVDVRAAGAGSKTVSVTSAYTGTLAVTATGLVPATRNSGNIRSGQTQCYNSVVPAGAKLARFQLFDAETSAAVDLDLDVFNGPGGTGTKVGSSGGGSAEEMVQLNAPPAGTYSACVIGFNTSNGAGGAVDYVLSSWVVGPAVGAQTLRASAPASVYEGGAATIGLGWRVPAGHRYLGHLQYWDTRTAVPVSVGTSLVLVDNR